MSEINPQKQRPGMPHDLRPIRKPKKYAAWVKANPEEARLVRERRAKEKNEKAL